jgi:hypothetical protein
LFSNDDISFHGPLVALINSDLSDRLTKLHHLAFDGLSVLIGLHLAAVLFYLHIKKNNLIRPMVTGYRDNAAGDSARGGGLIVFVVAIFIAAGVVCIASGALLPAPPPASVSVPAW